MPHTPICGSYVRCEVILKIKLWSDQSSSGIVLQSMHTIFHSHQATLAVLGVYLRKLKKEILRLGHVEQSFRAGLQLHSWSNQRLRFELESQGRQGLEHALATATGLQVVAHRSMPLSLSCCHMRSNRYGGSPMSSMQRMVGPRAASAQGQNGVPTIACRTKYVSITPAKTNTYQERRGTSVDMCSSFRTDNRARLPPTSRPRTRIHCGLGEGAAAS